MDIENYSDDVNNYLSVWPHLLITSTNILLILCIQGIMNLQTTDIAKNRNDCFEQLLLLFFWKPLVSHLLRL